MMDVLGRMIGVQQSRPGGAWLPSLWYRINGSTWNNGPNTRCFNVRTIVTLG